jgi:hypothetical protein
MVARPRPAIEPAATPPPVIDLMAVLKRSLAHEMTSPNRIDASCEKRAKAAPDRRQTGLLLPLRGGQKTARKRPPEVTRRRRKA